MSRSTLEVKQIPGHIVLRPARDVDYDAVAEVWHKSASLPDVGPAVMPSEKELRCRIDAELVAGWRVTVATDDDAVVGFVATRPSDAILCELFVHPENTGAGVGRALLKHAMTTMPRGFSLYTRSVNTKARLFYERAGLVRSHEDVHPRTGDPVTFYAWKR
ncbi:GNAT family N-acetyltransferase [Aurantimonas endophytica]|uniref:Putative acetyltransferase n=1 Tax=Aurantimonas endophytica TaxID=1522175 RepID=A0A7W6MMN3_9HYPH|nr:GNAT family N-acetyltransferase [Aurantimonas endophytica]MBB4001050.1 putative acetyltransferase [Aurantimonas endophytica]MCO6403294.1 GNAT family N-acetyltransferase [Aurantimonas endophytica]